MQAVFHSQDGPMVVGLAPQDASDRLIMFQVSTVCIFKRGIYSIYYSAALHLS